MCLEAAHANPAAPDAHDYFWAMAATDKENRKWSEGDVPDQSGRVVVVTGANTGIGYQTAAVLAHRGAHVVLAVRNPEKGNAALSRIVAAGPRADVTLQALDLSSLDSVRSAADALRPAYPRIDLLINNAGVMLMPKQVTKDGFELQFGTNHLGHFALTGLVLDQLLPVRGLGLQRQFVGASGRDVLGDRQHHRVFGCGVRRVRGAHRVSVHRGVVENRQRQLRDHVVGQHQPLGLCQRDRDRRAGTDHLRYDTLMLFD